MYRLTLFILSVCCVTLCDAQGGDVVYTKDAFVFKNGAVQHYANDFIRDNKQEFFALFMYGKQTIPQVADTTGYGFSQIKGDTAVAHCVWVYMADKNSCDVLRGEILFYTAGNKAMMQLRNLSYSKYERKGEGFIHEKSGAYKDLDVCNHCSTSGIVIGEMVQRNFLHLANTYHDYLKHRQKKS